MTRKFAIAAFMPLTLWAALMFFLLPQTAWAQGKTGTTLTLDGTNCTVLYSQGAASSTQAYFSYLRHNAQPIQIINANYYGLADNGTGFFKAMVNNMGITNGDITLYNNAGNFSELFIAIIAPQGYNIARYQMDVNSSTVRVAAAGNAAGAVIEEYTYTQNNSGGERVLTDNVFTLDGSSSQLIDVTKAGVNKLYFRVGFKNTQGYRTNGRTPNPLLPSTFRRKKRLRPPMIYGAPIPGAPAMTTRATETEPPSLRRSSQNQER